MILALDEGFKMVSLVVDSKLKKKIRFLVEHLFMMGP